MSAGYGRRRQTVGSLLMLGGILLVFVCLPVRFFLIALGVALIVCGLMMLC